MMLIMHLVTTSPRHDVRFEFAPSTVTAKKVMDIIESYNLVDYKGVKFFYNERTFSALHPTRKDFLNWWKRAKLGI